MYRCPWCTVSLGTIEYLSKHCKFRHGQTIGVEYSRRHKGDVIIKSHPAKNDDKMGGKVSESSIHGKQEIRLLSVEENLCKYEKCKFTSKNILAKTHQKMLSGDQEVYKCDVFGYSTNQLGNLKIQHQRIHTGEKPYKCDVCGYSTAVLSHLKRHQRIHTGEKPYKCDVCWYSTNVFNNLKTHQRIHTGEKPYKCDMCGYTCSDPSSLRQHGRIHPVRKPEP